MSWHTSGDVATANRIVLEMTRVPAGQYHSPYQIAYAYLGIEDREQAFKWLEASEERLGDTDADVYERPEDRVGYQTLLACPAEARAQKARLRAARLGGADFA